MFTSFFLKDKHRYFSSVKIITTGISYYRRLGKIVGTTFQAICAALPQVDTMNRQSGAFFYYEKTCKQLTPTTSKTPTNLDTCVALS